MLISRTATGKSAPSLGAISTTLIVVALAMIAARVPHVYAQFRADPANAFSDFNYYLYAFTTVLSHPADATVLYDHAGLVAFMRSIGARDTGMDVFYAYPPQFAWLFSPLGALSPLGAKTVWVGGSLVLFALGVAMVAKLAYRGADRGVVLLIVALALLSRPFFDDVYWGQSNELLFFLLAATFFFIDRGNRGLAGVFLGAAIALKVTPIAIAGLLLLRREWRTALFTFISSVVLTAITAWALGFHAIWHYVVSDMPRLNTQNLLLGGAPINVALRGGLQTVMQSVGLGASQPMLGAVWLATASVVCTLAVVLVARRHADRRIDFALATMTMLVASPMLEPVHLVVALIPVCILFGTAFERPGARLSRVAPRVELLLASLAIAVMAFASRGASYTVAVWLLYALLVARYFATGGVTRFRSIPGAEDRTTPARAHPTSR
ncbi:glycosyltransferase family 87 protein [Caballeronia sp. GAWG1-5s-s]|uniref:glycosyltransferase family 87 protein n=1 Tax=Caballeronia sp. GAWG1-5s-s TaxID=2921743 RepID=UPI002029770E|nr:glycosyltransferase family 87 protein [Caballeronia sp. GAWG1-5s-s]